MMKSIFYFKKLTKSDIWTLGLYSLLTIYLFYVHDLDVKLIFYYCIGTQMGIYVFYYKALRNLSFYFCWIAIGFIQMLMFYSIKDDPNLSTSIISSASNLRNTLPLVLLFQGFRILSLIVQDQELVSVSSIFNKDYHDDRYVNIIDFMLFFTYLMILVGLIFKWEH